jgi:hypothetical protein
MMPSGDASTAAQSLQSGRKATMFLALDGAITGIAAAAGLPYRLRYPARANDRSGGDQPVLGFTDRQGPALAPDRAVMRSPHHNLGRPIAASPQSD